MHTIARLALFTVLYAIAGIIVGALIAGVWNAVASPFGWVHLAWWQTYGLLLIVGTVVRIVWGAP